MEGVFWLFIVVVMAVIEIITLGLTTIWFAGGGACCLCRELVGSKSRGTGRAVCRGIRRLTGVDKAAGGKISQ